MVYNIVSDTFIILTITYTQMTHKYTISCTQYIFYKIGPAIWTYVFTLSINVISFSIQQYFICIE